MNNNRSILLRAALRTLVISTVPVVAHAQNSISLNFTDSAAGSTITSGTAGVVPVAASAWNNLNSTDGDGTFTNLIDSSGAPTPVAVTWTSANTWRSGGTTVNGNGQLTKGYLDDGNGGAVMNFSGIPYLSYTVHVIVASDLSGGSVGNANYRPITVNNTAYTFNGTATVPGTANWVGQNWNDGPTLTEGLNFLKFTNLGSSTLSIKGGDNSGGARGPIAGIQIQNAYSGNYRYWDLNGATAGAGGASPAGAWNGAATNWSINADGTGTPVVWGGTGNTAIFAAGADATGPYTVTVSGTQSADAIIVEQGNVTLSGGGINLSAPAVLRANPSSGLTINAPISGTNGLALEGAGNVNLSGTHTISGHAAFNGASVSLNNSTLTSFGSVEIGSGVSMIASSSTLSSPTVLNVGNGSQINSATSTITSGANINFNGSGYSASGASVLTAKNIYMIQGTGAASMSLAGTSVVNALGAVAPAQSNFEFNSGSLSLSDSSVINAERFTNRGSGLTHTLTISGNSKINVTDDLILGDNSNAAITVNQTGGIVTNTGTTNNPGANDLSNRWGHWGGGNTVYNLSGGSLNLTGAPLYFSWDGTAALNLSGSAVANLKGLDMGYGGRNNAATINLETGAKLNIGSAGIVSPNTNKVINLKGGTLGALANWVGTVPMNLMSPTVFDTTGGSFQIDGALTGAGTLTVQGGGTVSLGGVNTYPGATTVTGNSTLRFGQGGANTSLVTVQPGSSFGAGGLAAPGIGTADNVVSENGAGSRFRVSETAADMVDLLDLNIVGTHTLTVVPDGLIPENSVFTVIDYDTLSGAGYAGINVVSSTPRMVVTKEPNVDSKIDVKVVSFDALIWKGNNPTNPNLWDLDTTQNWLTSSSGVGSKFLQNDILFFDDTAATGNITLSGTLIPAAVKFSNSNLTYVLTGSGISGTTGVLKQGDGTLVLANANTYSGATVLEAGVLRLGNDTTGSLPTGNSVRIEGGDFQVNLPPGSAYSNPTTLNAGTLSFTGTGDIAFNANLLAGNGDLVIDRAGVVLRTLPTPINGTITVNSGTLAYDGTQTQNLLPNNKLITVNPGATFEHRGLNAFPTAGNAIDVIATGGTVRFITGGSIASGPDSNSHGHLRNLTLEGSTLELGYFGSGTSYNGESFQLNGVIGVIGTTPSVVNQLPGANAANSGVALLATSVIDVEDVTSSPAADFTINAEMESGDANTGALTKSGNGTLVLNQANSYPGATLVQAGAVVVNGSLAGGAVTVDPGATLGGAGTIGGTVNIPDGAILAPGNPVGDLTTGSATLAGIYNCEIDGSNGDTLIVNGDLDVTGGTLNLSVLGGGATQSIYVVASYTGNLTGTFATVNGLPGGYTLNYNAAAKRIELSNGTDAYGDWETLNGIAGAGGGTDSDGDGLSNGIEFVLGTDPSGPNSNSNNLRPFAVTDGTYLKFTFTRTHASEPYDPVVEYGSELTGWDPAINGEDNVVIEITPNVEPGVDSLEVRIPRSFAQGSKLFARLRVEIP